MSINSTNIQTQANKSNFGAELGTSLAFSGIMTGGFGSITAVKNHGGIRKAIKATKDNNDFIKTNYVSKLQGQGNDVFTRNIKTAYTYQDYTRVAKQNAKATRKLEKLKDATSLPFKEKIKNLFRSKNNKLDLNSYKAKLEGIQENFKTTQENIIKGENISDEILRSQKYKLQKKLDSLKDAQELPISEKFKNIFRKSENKINNIDDYKKLLNKKLATASSECLGTAKTFMQSTKGLFKSELKDPFGIFFAATETFTRIGEEVIPAFKNEGFAAGMKATGKALAAGVATWITDAGFSVVLRNIGATIGSFAGPAGTAIGSLVGNAVGGLLSCKLIQKIFPMKEQIEAETVATTNVQQPNSVGQKSDIQSDNQPIAQAQPNSIQQVQSTQPQEKWLTYAEVEQIEKGAQEIKNRARQRAYSRIPNSSFNALG